MGIRHVPVIFKGRRLLPLVGVRARGDMGMLGLSHGNISRFALLVGLVGVGMLLELLF